MAKWSDGALAEAALLLFDHPSDGALLKAEVSAIHRDTVARLQQMPATPARQHILDLLTATQGEPPTPRRRGASTAPSLPRRALPESIGWLAMTLCRPTAAIARFRVDMRSSARAELTVDALQELARQVCDVFLVAAVALCASAAV
jgi:hypothetical protein